MAAWAAHPAAMPVVLLGALLIRLWHLGARSVWTDEGSAWTAASSTFREMLRFCAERDASPPLFYFLTSLALRFGDDEAHLRLVSVLASVVLVWLAYRFARLMADRAESTLAAAIVAVSPYQLMYAQEARSYMLVALLSVGSLYLFVRAALLGRSRAWLPYVIVTTLALYTQTIAVLSLGIQGALLLFTAEGRRRIVPASLATLASVALYVPWLLVSVGQLEHLSQSHWYLASLDRQEIFQVPRALFLSPTPLVTPPPEATTPGLEAVMPRTLAHLILIVIPLLPLAAMLPSLIERGRRGFLSRVTAAALMLPLLAVLAVMHWKPLWLARYFVFLTPFLGVLLARGLVSLKPPPLRAGWITLFVVASLYACFRYDIDYSKERWREVAATVARLGAPGRTAVLVTFDLDPYRFYNSKLAQPVAAFEVSHPEVPFASGYEDRQLREMMGKAAERTATYDEVWVVVRSPNSEIRREVARRAEQVAARGRRFAGRWKWDAANGPLRVVRYVRPGNPVAATPVGP
jgi:4-amino-4-deoxy-L-arabinose transferase-like glycosyltransferase